MGSMPLTTCPRADLLHPVAKGYDIWGAAAKDKLAELMK
jgi:lysophospholipase L1-like esterase